MIHYKRVRKSIALAIFTGVMATLATPLALAAEAECPAQTVVLTGQNTVETPLGPHTYIETMVLSRQT
jgi:hypothetical protein